ncbi:hypothetical protein M885DRAFT_529151 [Pelagophyceae sp. CCMP2097]|nr:hypothetical protein M885DRAFT_529151 [Pelagophyceae sp. CCMP2097]
MAVSGLSKEALEASAVPLFVSHAASDVGRTVASSKRRFEWVFCFGPRGDAHVVQLDVSVVTGRRVVRLNGDVVLDCVTGRQEFAHAFALADAHLVRVAATKTDLFKLSVDGVPFGALRKRSLLTPQQAIDLDAAAARAALEHETRRPQPLLHVALQPREPQSPAPLISFSSPDTPTAAPAPLLPPPPAAFAPLQSPAPWTHAAAGLPQAPPSRDAFAAFDLFAPAPAAPQPLGAPWPTAPLGGAPSPQHQPPPWPASRPTVQRSQSGPVATTVQQSQSGPVASRPTVQRSQSVFDLFD